MFGWLLGSYVLPTFLVILEWDKGRGGKSREWTGVEFGKFQRAVEKNWREKTGCNVTCSAPTTLWVKGLIIDEDKALHQIQCSVDTWETIH